MNINHWLEISKHGVSVHTILSPAPRTVSKFTLHPSPPLHLPRLIRFRMETRLRRHQRVPNGQVARHPSHGSAVDRNGLFGKSRRRAIIEITYLPVFAPASHSSSGVISSRAIAWVSRSSTPILLCFPSRCMMLEHGKFSSTGTTTYACCGLYELASPSARTAKLHIDTKVFRRPLTMI